MTLSDIQPHYFPRLHYFARMFASEHFVIRDDVQFVKNHKFSDGTRGVSHQVHSPIKTNAGIHLLNVPVKKGGMLPIYQTQISYDQPWAKKQLNQLKSNYAKSPEFHSVFGEIEAILDSGYETVAKLNNATLFWALFRLLEGRAPESLTSLSLDSVNTLLQERRVGELGHITAGTSLFPRESELSASEKIVYLCNNFKATNYLAGGTAFDSYMDPEIFQDNQINIEVQSWTCQPYPQQNTQVEAFIPNLSIIDLLMNCPTEQALEILLFRG